jgi:hypothetical protein
MLDMGLAEGMNRVQIAELFSRKRSGKIFSFLPLAMMIRIFMLSGDQIPSL